MASKVDFWPDINPVISRAYETRFSLTVLRSTPVVTPIPPLIFPPGLEPSFLAASVAKSLAGSKHRSTVGTFSIRRALGGGVKIDLPILVSHPFLELRVFREQVIWIRIVGGGQHNPTEIGTRLTLHDQARTGCTKRLAENIKSETPTS